MSTRPFDRRGAFLPFLAYLGFVVYGSLVPFEYHALPMAVAVAKFRDIPYLELGPDARADWIANLLLYAPLAFLGCAATIGLRSLSALRHPAMLLVILFCLAVAVGVEFTQSFFEPRTVSVNDLVAEALGTVLGAAVFGLGRWRVTRLLDAIARGGRQSVVAAIVLYLLAYLALSLFPYDFLISSEEVSTKLASGNVGWLIAGDCSFGLRCFARLAGEAVAIVPLGLLIAFLSPGIGSRYLFTIGAVLGLGLELVQIVLASGVSQGISVLLRGFGLVAGAAAGRFLLRQGPAPLARLIRWAVPVALAPYLAALATLNGWLRADWLPLHKALGRLPEVRFLPFYYHYFTSETTAMASVLSQAGMYAPVGLAAWAFGMRNPGPGHGSPWHAALWAFGLALPIEFGKLLVPPLHPDPTNLMIVAASAAFVYSLASWLERVLAGGKLQSRRRRTFVAPIIESRTPPQTESIPERIAATRPLSRPDQPAPSDHFPEVETVEPAPAARSEPLPEHGARPRQDRGRPAPPPIRPVPAPAPVHPLGAAVGAAAFIAIIPGLWAYPVGMPWLVAGLLAYAVLLWYRPRHWLFVIPALLPALDFSTHTGNLPLDEFDLFVLVTLAMSYPRASRMEPRPWPNRWLPAALTLLWASWALSSVRGLWPLLDGETGLAAGSHSPLEAWRVGKGMLWALLCVPLLRRLPPQKIEAARRRAVRGFLAGLAIVVLVVLYERHVFVGVTDFENLFRVTGTFSGMNTGGAYIEAFLAFAFPLLAATVLAAEHWAFKVLGVAAAGLVTYAMMVTFSRGGYGGLAAGLIPLLWTLLRQGSRLPFRRWWVPAGFLAASTVAAVPVLSGGFAQSRLAVIGQDLSIREAHWRKAVSLMDPGPLSATLGMGFGRYPMLYLLRQESGAMPGTFGLREDAGNAYLRLGAGEPSFLDQFVDIDPETRYTLSLRIRQPAGKAELAISLCEKALLYSFDCVRPVLGPEPADGGWHPAKVSFESEHLGNGGNWPHRPVKLSLSNTGPNGPVDVDDVSLRSADGRELVANGGFEEDARRWLFITDQDLAWHIHQQEVEMYFAQGLLGLGALGVLLAGIAKVLWPALRAGDLPAAGLAGALTAFLTVGLLGSTLDNPRLAMVFYLGAWAAGLLSSNSYSQQPIRRRSHRI